VPFSVYVYELQSAKREWRTITLGELETSPARGGLGKKATRRLIEQLDRQQHGAIIETTMGRVRRYAVRWTIPELPDEDEDFPADEDEDWDDD
jgi:hypothetical protein